MTNDDRRNNRPEWIVRYEASAFCTEQPHDTEEAAYATARAARSQAEKGAFVDIINRRRENIGRPGIGTIRILHWNEQRQDWIAHARSWRRNFPHPEALNPLPDEYWN